MTQPIPNAPMPPVPTAVIVGVVDEALRVLSPGRRVVEVLRRPAAYASSHRLEDLCVTLDDGTDFELVLKHLGPDGMLDQAARVKPRFVLNATREMAAYDILLACRVDAPRCLDFHYDRDSGDCFLLLLKAPGVPLWQVGDMEAWRAAATWLALMHARLAGVVDRRKASPLLCCDRGFFETWQRRARKFGVARAGADPRAAPLVRLLDHYGAVVDRLLRLPTTLVHGEFHASNVLVDVTADGTRVLPVDWEMAGVGPGLLDVADLTAGKWSDDERRSLVDAYRQALPAALSPPADEFEAALDACRLHKAVQWLGWAPDWEPPEEHRHDWLDEALRLGEKLGLG